MKTKSAYLSKVLTITVGRQWMMVVLVAQAVQGTAEDQTLYLAGEANQSLLEKDSVSCAKNFYEGHHYLRYMYFKVKHHLLKIILSVKSSRCCVCT